MDTLTGALLAAAVAWISIVAAARMPGRFVPRRALQYGGAAAIALIGIAALGVPVPGSLPIGVLVGAAIAGWAIERPAATT